MKKINILFILLGISSIIGQTVLLRELLIEVRGNEIVFAIYLSLWLFLIAIGSLLARYFLNNKKIKSIVHFTFFFLSIIIPLQFLWIRILVEKLVVVSGEMINIPSLFFLALIVLTPGCLLMGFLFPILCKLVESKKQPVHKGYILECIGIIIGGILFAVLIHLFPHFTVLIVLSGFNLLLIFILSRKKLFSIPLILLVIFIPFSGKFFKSHYEKRYAPQELVSSKDSKYGRLDITRYQEQKNYYWNGEIFANTSHELYSQQMVNFVMLQHPEPKKILLIGGLLNGFIEEIKDYKAVEKIDYLELEKNILKEADANLKVNFIRADAVHYLKKHEDKYDLIFVDLPDPSSLNLNRFYTLDFFELLKTRTLSDSSVVAITLSSGTNFMTPEITQLNATIYSTFSAVFKKVVLIPSIKNIFIGSSNSYISNDVKELYSRLKFSKPWFNKVTIFEKCNKLRVNQILNLLRTKKPQINRITNPRAYLSTIMMWTRILGIRTERTIAFIQSKRVLAFLVAFIIIMICSIFASKLSGSRLLRTDFNIFAISLVNFVMQLVLLNLFQMHFGYVYLVIFLFTTVFMSGLTLGFMVGRKTKIPLQLFFIFNLVIILFVYVFFETNFYNWFYFVLNFGFAFLEGVILSRLLQSKFEKEKIRSGSSFYFLDTLGAMAGGLLVGVLMFPILGLKLSVLFLGMLILVNFLSSLRRV